MSDSVFAPFPTALHELVELLRGLYVQCLALAHGNFHALGFRRPCYAVPPLFAREAIFADRQNLCESKAHKLGYQWGRGANK